MILSNQQNINEVIVLKNKLSPWQIAVISVAGVAVIGGSAAGIGYGINKTIENSVDEKVNAALEDMYTQGTEPFEEDTASAETVQSTEPAQTEQEEKKPTENKSEPETVIVYVEPSTKAPEIPSTTEPLPKVTLVYDAKLTKELAELTGADYPEDWQDGICIEESENYFEETLISIIQYKKYPLNSEFFFVQEMNNASAQTILSAWTNHHSFALMEVSVYRVSGNIICAVVG